METNRNNLAAALILSLLVCLLGSIAWGFIYVAGYFAAIIALAEVILAIGVYSKFKTVNWKTILWISILTIIFNELAMYIAEIILLKMELNCTFGEATNVLNNAFSNPEIYSIFLKNSFTNILFTAIGIACYVFSYLKNKKQSKNQVQASKEVQQTVNQNISFNYAPNLMEQPKVVIHKEPETLEERLEEATKEDNTPVIQPKPENNPTKSDNPLEEITSVETVTNILLEEFTAIINKFKSSNNKDTLKADLKKLKETKIVGIVKNCPINKLFKLCLMSVHQQKLPWCIL